MTDQRADRSLRAPEGGYGGPAEEFDQEIRVRGIVWTAAGILAVTVVAMVLMWFLATGLKRRLVAADPAVTPVEGQQRARARAANAGEPAAAESAASVAAAPAGWGAYPRLALPAETVLPLAPRLQPSPETEMNEMLAAEERELSTYGWVDCERGIVRVPIDRAIDELAARGLPQFETAAPPPSAAAGATPESAAAAGQMTAAPGPSR